MKSAQVLQEEMSALKEELEAENAVLHFDVPSIIIHQRGAFSKSITRGLSVMELKQKDPKALQELNTLYQEVFYG